MIDFRYHLVSLISVFLALAVGIVLGAGPLKESIGTTLTKDVASLRAEKDTLRTSLDTADAAIQHRDTFLSTVTPSMIGGQLIGRSVAVVSLPGVDGDVVDPLVDAINTAGGTVTARVSIGGAWVDPNRETDRAKAITDLSASLPAGAGPPSGETSTQLAVLLADALVSTGANGEKSATTSAVLDALRSADLIGVKGDVSGLAGGALILAPPNPDGSDQKVKPTADGDLQATYLKLVTTFDTVGGGVVVSGPASAATGGGLLATIRKDGAAKSEISTVDTGSTPMGVITAMLALREQLTGNSGAYGFVGGGTKPMPALAVTTSGTVIPPATKK